MMKLEAPSGKTNQSRAPKRYVGEVDCGVESGPPANRITACAVAPSETRPAINYILGGRGGGGGGGGGGWNTNTN